MLPSLALPVLRTSSAYGLFISHAWDYASDYEGVVRLLNADICLNWNDLSIPIEKPIKMLPLLPKSNRRILKELEQRIKEADALLVLAGMYVSHSGWIQSEIEIAAEYSKPIIGIKPQGQERIPAALQTFACELVGWTTASMASAVRRHATPSHPASKLPNIAAPNLAKTLYPPSMPSDGLIPSIGITPSPVLPRISALISALTPPPTATQNVIPSGGLGVSNSQSERLAALCMALYDNK